MGFWALGFRAGGFGGLGLSVPLGDSRKHERVTVRSVYHGPTWGARVPSSRKS